VGIVSASQESQALVATEIEQNAAKQYDDAILTFNKAISLDPKDADAWYYKGMALGSEFKINEANAAIDHALLFLFHPINMYYTSHGKHN
jgi:Flp pilus assembly protein TadD